jgi:hypothetical protein
VFYLCNVVNIIINTFSGGKDIRGKSVGASDRGEKY